MKRIPLIIFALSTAVQAFGQMHYVVTQTIIPSEIKTGTASVDSKIQDFFNQTTNRLSYNYNWTTQSLDGGVHRISQILDITIDAQVAQRTRTHEFTFEIKTKEVNGEIVIMIDWVVTDKDAAATLHGTVGLHRISKSSIGSKEPAAEPEETIRSDGTPEVKFVFPPRIGSTGAAQSFQYYGTRGEMGSDGKYYVQGYVVTIVIYTNEGMLPGDDRYA